MRHLMLGPGTISLVVLAVSVAVAVSPAARADSGDRVSPQPDSPSAYYGVSPCRALDTRNDHGSRITAATVQLDEGQCAIPAGARAVVVSLHAVAAKHAGHLLAYSPEATSGQVPSTSVLAWSSPGTSSVEATIWLGITAPEVRPSVRLRSSVPTHLVVDVVGYYAPLVF